MKRPGRKYVVRGAALALALLLTALDFTGALAVTQADINALQSDADELDAKRKELESQLDSLSDDKAQALKRKELLDQQISNTSAQIANVEAQISEYEELITQTEAELADAEEREEAQYELFCSRVRSMEEQGTVSYWSVLFKADSFTDLLSRLDFVNEIMDYDQRVIQDLQDLQQEITEKKESLEDSRSESEAAKAKLVSEKSTLDKQRADAVALVNEINANEAEYQSTLDAIDAEEEAIQARIVELSRQLAAQQAASGQTTSNAALGGYIWPVSSRRITSPFGNRNTGIAGASTNHKGVDIGGVYYSSEVHAAKSGTVIVSQYSSSYGNYVVVSHGSGNTTLYAHMSSRSVSVGQWVDQGDVLGITGSTGISSGPHLHFEITENGVRVDPLQYLTGYVQAW
ncbi:peptidoglycan DD-metalloendopeptidase family protein [uncultured Oscillibacter sp.]|uniref:murein hydrolase activator EnvC family protein n=1 Tax=uncultured Oscillibacter sp. TaxID=876091 RepID=UPI002805CA37|nr:peptidoglycan DD-metalloendopeptidase family protein [uncultured Oscillibacter sp.]